MYTTLVLLANQAQITNAYILSYEYSPHDYKTTCQLYNLHMNKNESSIVFGINFMNPSN